MEYRRIASRLDQELATTEVDKIMERFASMEVEDRMVVLAVYAAAKAVNGECRVKNCGSTVIPVLDSAGLHWECNNPSRVHESDVVVGLAP